MNAWTLAARNLRRNRRRSLTTLTAIVIGVVSVLIFGGFCRDVTYSLRTFFIQNHAHLQVLKRDYFLLGTGDPHRYGIAPYAAISDMILHDTELAPLVRVVTPTLQFGGIAGNFAQGVSRTVWVTGMDATAQDRLRDWNEYGYRTANNRLALAGTPDDAATIGAGVARVLQLCEALHIPDCGTPARAASDGSEATSRAIPADIGTLADDVGREAASTGASRESAGARIELLAAASGGAPNVASLAVVSAENKGVKELDDVFVGMHLPYAQKLLYGRDSPKVTAIEIQLHHTSELPRVQQRLAVLLKARFPGDEFDVLDYAALNPFYGQCVAMFNTIFAFISVLIGAIVLFTVGNTMSMAIIERTMEIGTLRAMGLRRRASGSIFIREGILLGAAGMILGLCCSFVLGAAINRSGLAWTAPGVARPILLSVRIWGETGLIAGTSAGVIAMAALSAWLPARRAVKMQIVDALRYT
jgi:putative ABC transport system permease protein